MDSSNSYRKAVKYIIMFLTVSLSIKNVPSVQLSYEDTLKIACIAVVAFVILDMYSPHVSI
jgi:hypothetical protein